MLGLEFSSSGQATAKEPVLAARGQCCNASSEPRILADFSEPTARQPQHGHSNNLLATFPTPALGSEVKSGSTGLWFGSGSFMLFPCASTVAAPFAGNGLSWPRQQRLPPTLRSSSWRTAPLIMSHSPPGALRQPRRFSAQMPNSGCPSCWEQLVVARLRSPSSSGTSWLRGPRRKTSPPEKHCDRFLTQTTVGGVSCWLLIVEQRGSLRMERHNAAMVPMAS